MTHAPFALRAMIRRWRDTIARFAAALFVFASVLAVTSAPRLGESHFAQFGTNRVHYLVLGSGSQTVLLIHGWGGNTDFWREQIPVLTKRAKVIAVDLPGHGQSDKPKVDYTLDYFAQGVLAVFRDARIEKAIVIGHSMGVAVICRVYALAPEKVTALVPIDGLLRRPKGASEEFERFIAPYRTPEYQEHTKKFIAAMFPNPGTDALRDWTVSSILATPQYVLSSAMDGMFKTGQLAWDLPKVNIPLLVLNAENPMWTPEYQTHVRSLSDHTDYQTITNVGHFLMLEKPSEFNALLLKMLGGEKLIDSGSGRIQLP